MIETALTTYLKTLPAMTAIFSTRMYVGTLPSTVTYPALSIVQISQSVDYTHRYDTVRLQVTITAETYKAAKDGSQSVINSLNSFEGILSGLEIGSIKTDAVNNFRDDKRFIFAVDFVCRYINK